jgi:hypothetical protein
MRLSQQGSPASTAGLIAALRRPLSHQSATNRQAIHLYPWPGSVALFPAKPKLCRVTQPDMLAQEQLVWVRRLSIKFLHEV